MKRFDNIDLLRGLVMFLMCIDHAIHTTGISLKDPMIISETPTWLFVLRIFSHLCAPTFILLAGISIGISGAKKDKKELSWFLFTRGFVLCILELTIVNWGWSFNPFFGIYFLQVIWAIGIGMMAMAILIHLNRWNIFGVSVTILALHNLVDDVRFEENSVVHYVWSFLLQMNRLPIVEDLMVRTTYPVLPVIAVMALGYWMSTWFTQVQSSKRKRKLLTMSLVMFILFIFTRLIIGYGDSKPYESEYFIKSIFNLTKYPLSLNFVLLYLSISIAILAITENKHFKDSNVLMALGKAPMLFYILHLYVLHTIVLICVAYSGYAIDMYASFGGVPAGFALPAWSLFLTVPFTILILLPSCKSYYKLKQTRKYKWTSYI